jgi:hypothetical protein
MLRPLTLALLLVGSAASAQAPAPDVRQACAADAARVCPNTPREHGQMMSCMRGHWNDLSQTCRSAVIARRAAMKGNRGDGQAPPAPNDTGPR